MGFAGWRTQTYGADYFLRHPITSQGFLSRKDILWRTHYRVSQETTGIRYLSKPRGSEIIYL